MKMVERFVEVCRQESLFSACNMFFRVVKDEFMRYFFPSITVKIVHGNIKTIIHRSAKQRAERWVEEKTIDLITESLCRIDLNKVNRLKICIDTNDVPPRTKKRGRMAYSINSNSPKAIPIPDYSFCNWNGCPGKNSYDTICNQIIEKSLNDPIYDTLFWIGKVQNHSTRKTLMELSIMDKRIEAYDTMDPNRRVKFVSLPDHTQYRYLIDIQGVGWTDRTKYLMFSGRPLFLVERKWHEYWYGDIEPFVHYIPVKEDLSDLQKQLNWAEANYQEALSIAHNAQEYAKHHLRHENAIEYLVMVLKELIAEKSS